MYILSENSIGVIIKITFRTSIYTAFGKEKEGMSVESYSQMDIREKSGERHPIFQMNHYLYVKGEYTNMVPGKRESIAGGLEAHLVPYQREDGTIVMKTDFFNNREEPLEIRLFVENIILGKESRFGFVSPKRDVIYITDENCLCIASGIFREKSLCQYGILQREHLWNWLQNGQIPFRPLGMGEVAGIYTLEKVLAPKEQVSAYTWMIYSQSMSEQELLKRDHRLKTALAFL